MAKKKQIEEVAKDINGNILEKDDWCYFWNDDEIKKVKYQFYDTYHREHKYISIDRNDKNDLSYWKHCKKID